MNDPRYDHRREGVRRKDAVLVLLEVHREVIVRLDCRTLLEALLLSGTATSDDVRAAVELPQGIDPKVFGCVPGILAQAGIIRRDGFARKTRLDAHTRAVSVRRLADPTKSQWWSAGHPCLAGVASGDAMESPINREAAPGATGTASVQQSFPAFEKGSESHG